jgi:protein-tyrosine phosphatase
MSLSLQEEDQTIAPYFYSAVDFITDALAFGFNVLVHCKTGNDRSAALAASFIISHFGVTAKEAV